MEERQNRAAIKATMLNTLCEVPQKHPVMGYFFDNRQRIIGAFSKTFFVRVVIALKTFQFFVHSPYVVTPERLPFFLPINVFVVIW